MSLMVTQGLLGSRLITQGLVGGVTSTAFSPSGGLTRGGGSPSNLSRTFFCSGGIRVGGFIIENRPIYHVYMNTEMGGEVNYASPVSVRRDLSWTSSSLSAPGDYRFTVRVTDPVSGLEEQNIDASVRLILDASGRDVTRMPPSPVGLRAIPIAGGRVRVEWSCPGAFLNPPEAFKIYVGDSLPDYGEPFAVIPFSTSRLGTFTTEISGLADGQTYVLAVRSVSRNIEDDNSVVLAITVDSTPPSTVESLQAIATNQES